MTTFDIRIKQSGLMVSHFKVPSSDPTLYQTNHFFGKFVIDKSRKIDKTTNRNYLRVWLDERNDKWSEGSSLNIDECYKVFHQILNATAYLHSKGIIKW